MVGGLVQNQHVSTGNHQLRQHTADLLASGQNLDLLYAILSCEEHTAQEATHVSSILDLGILGQPVNDGVVVVELLGVVLGKIGLAGGDTPFISTLVRLHFARQNLKEGCFGKLVAAYKGYLVVMAQNKGNIIQNLHAVDGLGQAFHGQHFISDLAVRTEINVRILPAGGTDLVQLDFLQSLLSGGCLLGLGSVSRETGDKFLQLLDLLFLLLVGLLHLANQQLAGFVPEVVVTGIELNLAVIDVGDMGADLIQEITVMGYYDDGVREVNQELLQPCDSVQIQVVGRLVQKQDIRVAEQCLRQQNLDLLGTQEILHQGVVKIGIDTQAV